MQIIIRDLKQRGIGVLITDHNVQKLLEITDRAYILSEGEVKTSGTSEELIQDPIAQKYYLGQNTTLALRRGPGGTLTL